MSATAEAEAIDAKITAWRLKSLASRSDAEQVRLATLVVQGLKYTSQIRVTADGK